jgi:hypothetical protein
MLICGRTWEDIQRMQQGGSSHAPVIFKELPTATQCDIEMLRDKGIDYIKGNGLFGVIDRLQNSGILTAAGFIACCYVLL